MLIPSGSAEAAIVVEAIDDDIVEETETVAIEIEPQPTAYEVGAASSAVVSLISDDVDSSVSPIVSVVATDAQANEAGTATAVLTFSLDQPAAGDLAVAYSVTGSATPGDDYQALPGTVVFALGQQEIDLTVTPIDDDVVEDEENIIVTIDSDDDYEIDTIASTAAVVIVSDDANVSPSEPQVSLVVNDSKAAEAGLDQGQFTVSLDQPAGSPPVVNYSVAGTALSGADYQALSGSIAVAMGADSAVIDILPLDDLLVEMNETVEVTLTAGTDYQLGATTSGVVTISSDDVAMPSDPVVSLTVSDGAAAGRVDTGVITRPSGGE